MDNRYDVDNILEEIKRKKSLRDRPPTAPAVPARDSDTDFSEKRENAPFSEPPHKTQQPVRDFGPATEKTEQLPRTVREPVDYDVKKELAHSESEYDGPAMIPTGNLPPPTLKGHRTRSAHVAENFGKSADITDRRISQTPEPAGKFESFRPKITDFDEPAGPPARSQTHDHTYSDKFSEPRDFSYGALNRDPDEGPQPEEFFVPAADTYEETPAESDSGAKVIDDFDRPADAGAVAADIRAIKFGLFIRFFVLAVLAGVSVYLSFARTNYSLPLPPFMLPEESIRAFLAVNLGTLLAACIVSSNTVGGGLIALFKLKPDNDTPVALAALLSIAQGAALTAFPQAVEGKGVHMYFSVVLFSLLFNTLGKLFMVFRIQKNFEVFRNPKNLHAFTPIKNKNLIRELMRGKDGEIEVGAFTAPVRFASDFLDISYSEDASEDLGRIITPVFSLFAVIFAIVCRVISGDIFVALTALSAALCIAAPFSGVLTAQLPLLRLASANTVRGAAVTGPAAGETYGDCGVLAADAGELFPAGSITLKGIKVFDQKRIDEAILDAASVICKHKGILSDIFLEIIGRRENILKNADSLVYEDTMGLSAWVDGKRVLIGNRALMHNHSIDTPSRDYESKYTSGDSEILYLSNSGELTAMFVLSYAADNGVAFGLEDLKKRKTALCVHTVDPNVTADKIAEIYAFPRELVHIMPAKLHEEFYKRTESREKLRGELVFSGDFRSKASVLTGAIKSRTAIFLGIILQSIGMLAGYGLVAFFAFTGSLSALTFDTLLVFEIVWALLIMLVPSLVRYR